MNIKKVGNVILAVQDLDKSIQFYNEIIGLPIKDQRKTWVDLGTSGALLSLHPASSTAEHVGGSIDNGISVGFLVGDLKSAIEELKTKGVTSSSRHYRKRCGQKCSNIGSRQIHDFIV